MSSSLAVAAAAAAAASRTWAFFCSPIPKELMLEMVTLNKTPFKYDTFEIMAEKCLTLCIF